MMKQFLILIFAGILCLSVNAEQTDRFVENFLTCSSYTERDNSEMFGMQVQSTLEVLGWRGDLCGFRTSITTPSGEANIECNFTEEQIAELVTAMQENSAEIESVARQGLESNPQIGENPAVVIFNKYFGDTSVCTVTN